MGGPGFEIVSGLMVMSFSEIIAGLAVKTDEKLNGALASQEPARTVAVYHTASSKFNLRILTQAGLNSMIMRASL
jgi:hypothetical protein